MNSQRILTPEQQAAMARLKTGGHRRIMLDETPEQRAVTEQVIAAEEAAIPANLEYMKVLDTAAEEPGFSGDLRRAIRATKKSLRTVATEAGLDPELIDRFCRAEAILPGDVIDRLVTHLHLRLTPVEQ
jgi:hypothetical protein